MKWNKFRKKNGLIVYRITSNLTFNHIEYNKHKKNLESLMTMSSYIKELILNDFESNKKVYKQYIREEE